MKYLLFIILLTNFCYGGADSLLFNSKYYKMLELNSSLNYKINENESSPFVDHIDYNKLYGVIGIYSAFSVGSFYYFNKTWWSERSDKFHFQDDLDYALWIDKIGHFYGTQMESHFNSAALEYTGVDIEKSYIYGALAAFTFQTLIEIKDGFGKDWGFSKYDQLANFLGASYFLAQYYIPELNNFQFKWSYLPSDQLKKDKNRNVTDDYEGQTYYLSVKIAKYLPENIWPKFLALAIGYGIRNWSGYGLADKEFSLCLDYDLDAIPLYGKFWQFVKNTLNYIHLPAPGIKYSNNNFYFTICY